MEKEKIIKEIGVYVFAFAVTYLFFWKVFVALGPKVGRLLDRYFPEIPSLYIIFLPSFLISFFIIYIFTKNLKKSFLISIIIDSLIIFLFFLESYSSALR